MADFERVNTSVISHGDARPIPALYTMCCQSLSLANRSSLLWFYQSQQIAYGYQHHTRKPLYENKGKEPDSKVWVHWVENKPPLETRTEGLKEKTNWI